MAAIKLLGEIINTSDMLLSISPDARLWRFAKEDD